MGSLKLSKEQVAKLALRGSYLVSKDRAQGRALGETVINISL